MQITRGARRPLLILLGLVVAGLALAACGSSSSSSSAPATTTTAAAGAAGGPQSAAFTKYAACLKAHGASLPAFGGRSRGSGTTTTPPTTTTTPGATRARGSRFGSLTAAQRAALTKAQAACSSLLPAGARGGFGRGFGGGGFSSPAFAAYRNCLKLHGVTLSAGIRPGTTQTAKQKAAYAACAALRPARPSGAPGSGSVAPSAAPSSSASTS